MLLKMSCGFGSGAVYAYIFFILWILLFFGSEILQCRKLCANNNNNFQLNLETWRKGDNWFFYEVSSFLLLLFFWSNIFLFVVFVKLRDYIYLSFTSVISWCLFYTQHQKKGRKNRKKEYYFIW